MEGKNLIVVGVDIGYGFVKTANYVFSNGVKELGQTEPSLIENSLFFEGKYYKVGEGRLNITDSKLNDENARLLTMVAIAKELRNKGRTNAEIVLAVGLPFTNFGNEKYDVINYYNRCPEINFEYEGVLYNVILRKTLSFPQCYAAIAPRLANMLDSDYIVVDVGSKTTDVVMVKKGHPIESKSVTIETAMIKWLRYIQSQLQIQCSKDIPEEEIQKVLLNEKHLLPSEFVSIIKETMESLLEDFELELQERGYNLDFSNVVFVGGGAVIAKTFLKSHKDNYMFDCDLKANAKGYEYLANVMLEKAGGRL